MSRTRKNEASISGADSVALGDLRWLIDQAKNMDDNVRVRVNYTAAYDQRDGPSVKLTVDVIDTDG